MNTENQSKFTKEWKRDTNSLDAPEKIHSSIHNQISANKSKLNTFLPTWQAHSVRMTVKVL